MVSTVLRNTAIDSLSAPERQRDAQGCKQTKHRSVKEAVMRYFASQ